MTTKITDANIDSDRLDNTNFNISLLGFKMAVNEGLTVFNLVDGVVDEFNDESGTDEAEGSNDLYCGTSDYYINSNSADGNPITGLSAGFTTTSITEPDTSTAGTNPTTGSGTFGTFTVPCGTCSVNIFAWGASGGTKLVGPGYPNFTGGGAGGFASGTLAVTPGQSLAVVVGETSSDLNGGLGGGGPDGTDAAGSTGGAGGGLSGVFVTPATSEPALSSAPQAYVVAGGGGGSGHMAGNACTPGIPSGAGGGLVGDSAGSGLEGQAPQTGVPLQVGGGGTQVAGGQSDPLSPRSQNGTLFGGGQSGGAQPACQNDANTGGGGSGYYGGGGGSGPTPNNTPQDLRGGGGGSSYYGHPQITCGATEEGSSSVSVAESGGAGNPFYVACTGEGYVGGAYPNGPAPNVTAGEDGYVLIQKSAICATAQNTTIVSTAFTSTSVPTSARIVVFEENVDTPTLNTDIIASISRDGGTTFTNATLSDSGYVTGSSGQRILTGQATISGQPSGQSMRWKLALTNNQVKIHGVSLQWA
jgi:hypothetical protein